MSEIFYEQIVNLRTNDFDTNDNIKVSALLELFQDVAGLHANQIGIGFTASYEKGFFWVLLRNKVDVFKNPTPLTNARLKTWPHEKGRVDCNREYLLEDMDGNPIARCISKWVIINRDTRRLMRVDAISYGEGELVKDNYYEDVPKVQSPDISLFKKVLTHKVSKNDIDHNRHMNNAKYTDLIFDSIEGDLFIKNLEIEYVKEAKYEEELDLYMYDDNEAIYHIGMIGDTKIFVSKIVKE